MKDIERSTRNTEHRIIRDESDTKYWFQLAEDTTALYERNKRIRLEGLMRSSQKVPFFGDEVAYAFSMPQNWRTYLKANYPDVLQMLDSKDPEDQLRAGFRLAVLEPNWVVMEGNW